jgi:glycosyltransferase involved in cell wall biosynthesis
MNGARPSRSGLVPERRLLIVSYYFPPDAAVGGLRVSKFARCLRAFNWRPFVLTVTDDARDQGLDRERLRGLEDVTIVRTRALPGLLPIFVGLKSLARRVATTARGRRGAPMAAPATPSNRAPQRDAAAPEGVVERLKRYFVSLVVLLPDDKKKWALSAAYATVRTIRAHRIECVVTSSPPASLHLAGLVARALTGVKWVADFRDPWIETLMHERKPETRSWAGDRLERWMETLVMTRADKVVVTTARLRDSLRQRYPMVPADRFTTVPNSIDTDKFPTGVVEKYEPLTITYAGTLYIDRTPEPLFKVVGDLIRAGVAKPTDIRIKLLGHCRTVDGVDTTAIAARHGVESSVEILDFVPHSRAIEIMQRSHLLLVLAPRHHEHIVPAKMYDYLGSGSQVLALAEEGATTDLMAETNCGRWFSLADADGLRDYLRTLLQARAYRHLKNDPTAFSKYDATYLTGQLAREMDALSGPPPVTTMMVRT